MAEAAGVGEALTGQVITPTIPGTIPRTTGTLTRTTLTGIIDIPVAGRQDAHIRRLGGSVLVLPGRDKDSRRDRRPSLALLDVF